MSHETHALRVDTDDLSLEMREGILHLGDQEVRIPRNDLELLIQQIQGVISQIDWYHADYFYVSDIGTNHSHLVHDTTNDGEGGRDLEALKRQRTLCGRKPDELFLVNGQVPGWELYPVIERDGADTWGVCKTCLRIYHTQQALERRKVAEALGRDVSPMEEE